MEPFRQKKLFSIGKIAHPCTDQTVLFFMPLFSVTDEMVFDALYIMKSSLHCYI